ncbi:diguanylate cyclase [Aeromonas jandaei]|uniref:GGDEF domain-containing protein n=1 Tax=Aeromonas jandaei TaxID=650 RepID=UPI0036700DC6
MRRHIDRVLPLDELRRLRFSEPRESQFQHFYVEAYARRSGIYLIFGMVVFLLFGISDAMLLDHALWPVLRVRLVVTLVLLVILGVFVYLSYQVGHRHIMAFESCGLVINNGAIVYIAFLAMHDGVPEYQMGTLLVILFAATLSRLTFRYCALTISLCLGSYCLLLLVPDMQDSRNITINNLAVFMATTVIAMINCYQREYDSRRDFITSRLLEEQHGQLKEAQARLTWLVERDALTGLYNRRHFDHHFGYYDKLCRYRGKSLSLLLIDVDHFKRYNDGYGHLAGDECLRLLGHVLSGHARRKEEFAARIGGEEFALVLPGLTLEEAVLRGEAFRQDIQALALSHPDGNLVSVSVGVAAKDETTPWCDGGQEWLRLLADQALYRAKDEGRNRVVSAAMLVEPS